MTLHHRNNSGGERWEQWGENPVPTTPIPLLGGGGGNGGVRGGVSASGEVLTLRHFKNAGGAGCRTVASGGAAGGGAGQQRGKWRQRSMTVESNNRLPEYSDECLALRFATAHAGDLRYIAARRRWYRWSGTIWAPDGTLAGYGLVARHSPAAAAEITTHDTSATAKR